MSSSHKNLSDFTSSVPNGTGYRFGIVVAEWNSAITFALRDGAIRTLTSAGVSTEDIHVHHVPGSYELPVAASWLISYAGVDAVICIGCVIQGDTPHFDYICQGVTQGIMQLNTETEVPVIFGVLTVLNQEQALERAGGQHGNKGEEAAFTALKMVALHQQLIDQHHTEEDEEGDDDNLIEFP